jgi:phage terminase small subunit
MSNALAKRGLTPKQRLFALEWSKDCNATQAAIRAGYSAKGADVQGHKLLSN